MNEMVVLQGQMKLSQVALAIVLVDRLVYVVGIPNNEYAKSDENTRGDEASQSCSTPPLSLHNRRIVRGVVHELGNRPCDQRGLLRQRVAMYHASA